MKLLGVTLLVGLALAAPSDRQVVNKEFLDGYNKFTSNLYKEVALKNSKNFLISPISIDVLLALAEYGSAGETSKQLMKGLNLPENKEKIRDAFTSLTPKLNSNDKYTLSSANKIYIKKGFTLLDDFQKIATEVYSAPVESIDFGNSEEAANIMNKWVEKQTHDKIKDLVPKEQITADTRTFFINAMYFRGKWVTKFDPANTAKGSFYLDDKNKADVNLMETTSKFNFYDSRDLDAKFLELPYVGDDVTMTIVLPNKNDGLQGLESNLDKVLVQHLRPRNVNVKIPKFEIETSIEFNDYLKNLGIVNAFDHSAEFPKITGEKLEINKAIQKARIEVDEEGTTAAVASAVDEVSRSAHVLLTPEEFIADHPFIFLIKYKSLVLFIGHYSGKSE